MTISYIKTPILHCILADIVHDIVHDIVSDMVSDVVSDIVYDIVIYIGFDFALSCAGLCLPGHPLSIQATTGRGF